MYVYKPSLIARQQVGYHHNQYNACQIFSLYSVSSRSLQSVGCYCGYGKFIIISLTVRIVSLHTHAHTHTHTHTHTTDIPPLHKSLSFTLQRVPASCTIGQGSCRGCGHFDGAVQLDPVGGHLTARGNLHHCE